MNMKRQNNNYLNLQQSDSESNIYRYMPIRRLIELVTKKSNTLTRPRMWDDPYENFVVRSRTSSTTGENKLSKMRDYVFAQCWTLQTGSDALWRIYSPYKDGVKIKTTIPKLFDSLSNVFPRDQRDTKCFIGRVESVAKKNLKNRIDRINNNDGTCKGIAEALLIKRKAFDYEFEVRLIYVEGKNEDKSEVFRYKINPNELIELIAFDPRMDEYLCRAYRMIFRKAGLKCSIVQADTYKKP